MRESGDGVRFACEFPFGVSLLLCRWLLIIVGFSWEPHRHPFLTRFLWCVFSLSFCTSSLLLSSLPSAGRQIRARPRRDCGYCGGGCGQVQGRPPRGRPR